MAFEWLVEARDQGTCVVRLVNSGFVEGAPWDDQYDAMREGWKLFLANLRLHLEHFPGQTATAMLPTAAWPVPTDQAWPALVAALGIPARVAVGDRVVVAAPDAPPLAGVVADAQPGRLALVLDAPAPGTAFLAAEEMGDQSGVSIWQYLYGSDREQIVERDQSRWAAWLEAHGAGSGQPARAGS
jgi:hypothetical protein